jgi:hypothetical protein
MLILNKKTITTIDDIGKPTPADHKAFLTGLIESPLQFAFATFEELETFLKDNLNDFKGAEKKFRDPNYQPLFERIAAIGVTVNEDAANLSHKLTVKTDKSSSFEITVFTSKKRHLLLSFMQNQFTERRVLEKNSIVRDATLFRDTFDKLVGLLKDALLARKYAFGFDPRVVQKICSGWTVAFETDSLPLNLDPSKGLDVHCYPSTGAEVRQLNRAEYDAVVTFLLWFFRTEQTMCYGVVYNSVKHNRFEHGDESPTYKGFLASLDKKAAAVQTNLSELVKLCPLDAAKSYSEADLAALTTIKSTKQLLPFSTKAITGLYELMVQHGVVPQVTSSLVERDAVRNPSKPNLLKAAKPAAPGKLLFKTHKVEVKSHLASMPWPVLAWLLEGHLQVDLNEIQVRIEAHKVDKTRHPNLATQIMTADDNTKRALIDRDKVSTTLNNLLALYNTAQTAGIDLLKFKLA